MRYYTHSLYDIQLWLFGAEVYIQKDSVCTNWLHHYRQNCCIVDSVKYSDQLGTFEALSSVMIVTIIHDGNASIHTSLVAMLIIFIFLETHTYNGGDLQHYK